jgi:hypothetical protein
MKKVLLITRDFIPFTESLGGLIRVLTLADYLFRNGFQVFILTSRGYEHGYFGYEEEIKRYSVVYINDMLKYNKDKNAKRHIKGNTWKSRLMDHFRAFVRQTIVPDKHIILVRSYFSAAVGIIRENGIKNLIISSPPFSLQITGYFLKRKFGSEIMFLSDYRDSWNTTAIHSPNNPVSRCVSRWLERKILRICDNFTYVSEPILLKIKNRLYDGIEPKSRLVMNGFSKEIPFTKKNKLSAKIVIGYFGSISDSSTSFRNMSNLFGALKLQAFRNTAVEFHFYGAVELKRHDLANYPNIKYSGVVSHKEAIEKMMECDYLLIVHSESRGSDEVVTGKFFEYVATRTPILCLGPLDMEANRLIKKYGIGMSIDIGSVTAIVEGLNNLKPMYDSKFLDMDISIFHRDNQYANMLPMFN